MATRSQIYICNTCGATIEVHARATQSNDEFRNSLTQTIPCGVLGCQGTANIKR